MIHILAQNFDNEPIREGASTNLLTHVIRSHKTGESRYCFLNVALVKILHSG